MIDQKKLDETLSWAREQQKLVENDYYDGYAALLDLFTKLDLTNELEVTAGAYAVYGWMPTIMKRKPDAKRLIAFVQSCNDSSPSIEFLKRDKCVLKAINNSIVGTSKFLHFFASETFPIWDGNIARAFDASGKIEDPETYIRYCEILNNYEEPAAWPNEISEFDPSVSKIRRLEFCLYAYGRHLGKERRATQQNINPA